MFVAILVGGVSFARCPLLPLLSRRPASDIIGF